MKKIGIIETLWIIVHQLLLRAVGADYQKPKSLTLPAHLVPKKFELGHVIRLQQQIYGYPKNALQPFQMSTEEAELILRKYRQLVRKAVESKDCDEIFRQIIARFGDRHIIRTEQDLASFLRLCDFFHGIESFWEQAWKDNDKDIKSRMISHNELWEIFYPLVHGHIDGWEGIWDNYWHVVPQTGFGMPLGYFSERISKLAYGK